MSSTSSFVFLVLLAAMAAYWRRDLFELVGIVVVVALVVVAGACCLSSPRAWLATLLHNVAELVVESTIEDVNAEAREAEAKENARLRAQVVDLEQQLRGTEARARDSEIAREAEKRRHDKEVRRLDAQLASVSRGIKESLRAKDQVLGECRHWRRKFEDLEDLQRQAQENPIRGIQGRARWAPAKKYGVTKRERVRPARKLTAIAQVAIVNAVCESKLASCESKLASFESEARDYVARTTGQIGSLHAAATSLSEENAYLKQQIQAKPAITHELAQQRLDEAVQRTMVFADQQHEERVNSLKQTYLKELMAAKVDYERKLNEAMEAIKAKEIALAQQREVAEGTAHEVSSLKHQLAAQETQMGKLRDTNAEIAGDLQVTKEAREKLNTKLEQETAQVVKCVQKKDWYSRTYKDLKAKYESLLADNDELVRGRENLEVEIEELKDALDNAAEQQGAWEEHAQEADAKAQKADAKVAKLEDDNRILVDHNEELFCTSIAADLEHQKTLDRVGNLEQKVQDYQTAEASDITSAVQGFGMDAD